MQMLLYALAFPLRPIFSLDASGSITDEFIKLVYQLPRNLRESLERRIVYDRMGDPDWVVPLPFFSRQFGLYYEDQVQRVVGNFVKLSQHLVEGAPVLGGLALKETATELYRLLCAIQDENGASWQITEAKKLLLDYGMLGRACKQFGAKVPEAKSYFEKQLLSDQVSNHERELRTFTLRSVLGMIEPRAVRARVGYHLPGWTPNEAIEKGLIVLVSGEHLINQEQAQAILFTDVFSQILAQVNKRTPHDPNDEPILLVIDEVPMLLKIPGMAEEIGKISPQYRSRGVNLILIIQALWQLAENLEKQIWSLGNVVSFGIDDFNEAYTLAQQLFEYDPQNVKLEPTTDRGQPVIEADRGQYLTEANWIQHLKHREAVMRCYVSEAEQEPLVRHIERTSEKPNTPPTESIVEIKERLLRQRAIPVKDALKVINERKLTFKNRKQRPTV
jgi:hypothetical protein